MPSSRSREQNADKDAFQVCFSCKGRAAAIDLIERDGKRIVLRTLCPSCRGRGVIDITRGPVTGDDYR